MSISCFTRGNPSARIEVGRGKRMRWGDNRCGRGSRLARLPFLLPGPRGLLLAHQSSHRSTHLSPSPLPRTRRKHRSVVSHLFLLLHTFVLFRKGYIIVKSRRRTSTFGTICISTNRPRLFDMSLIIPSHL